MNMKNIVTLVTGAIVMLLVVSGVLVPIISSATAESDTYFNSGYMDLERIGINDVREIVWDPSTPDKISIDGDVIEVQTPFNLALPIVYSDDWIIRYWQRSDGTYVQGMGLGTDNIMADTVSNVYPMTISMSNGVANVTVNEVTKTLSYDSAYVHMDGGSYTIKKANESVYLSGSSEIDFTYSTSVNGAGGKIVNFNGTIENGINVVPSFPPNYFEVANVTTDAVALDNHVSFYSISKISYDVKLVSDDDTYETLIQSYFTVPKEITVDRTEPLDGVVSVLLNTLAVLSVLAILIYVTWGLKRRT